MAAFFISRLKLQPIFYYFLISGHYIKIRTQDWFPQNFIDTCLGCYVCGFSKRWEKSAMIFNDIKDQRLHESNLTITSHYTLTVI
jgi:hypothetical protein